MNIFIEIQPLDNQSRHNPASHSHSLSQPGCQVIVFGGFQAARYCVVLCNIAWNGISQKKTDQLCGSTTSDLGRNNHLQIAGPLKR